MQKRLESVEPIYRIADWVEDWKKNADLTEMITQFPSMEQSPPTIAREKKVSEQFITLVLIIITNKL